MGELGPDLVGAAGVELHPHQGQGLLRRSGPAQHPVGELRLPDALPGPVDDEGLVGAAVVKKQILQGGLLPGGDAPEHGQVFLLRGAGGDLVNQRRGSRLGAGQHHEAAHGLVQPVDGADRGILAPAAQPSGSQLRQIPAGPRLGKAVHGLLADEDIPVAV